MKTFQTCSCEHNCGHRYELKWKHLSTAQRAPATAEGSDAVIEGVGRRGMWLRHEAVPCCLTARNLIPQAPAVAAHTLLPAEPSLQAHRSDDMRVQAHACLSDTNPICSNHSSDSILALRASISDANVPSILSRADIRC
jgi:hypothetical protein